jgi:hypothetical protein
MTTVPIIGDGDHRAATAPPLLSVQEAPDIWADACLRDGEGRFLFLSLFGRDGAVLQFLSAMELPRAEHGIDRFHLVDPDGREHAVDVGGTDRLAKHSGRLPQQNLFGPLSHVWLFDASLTSPDRVNRHAWVLRHHAANADDDASTAHLLDRAWEMVQSLSPVPLLDAWRGPLMQLATDTGMVRLLDDPLFPPLGPVRGARVSLGQQFLPKLGELVACGVLRLPPAGHAPRLASAA